MGVSTAVCVSGLFEDWSSKIYAELAMEINPYVLKTKWWIANIFNNSLPRIIPHSTKIEILFFWKNTNHSVEKKKENNLAFVVKNNDTPKSFL